MRFLLIFVSVLGLVQGCGSDSSALKDVKNKSRSAPETLFGIWEADSDYGAESCSYTSKTSKSSLRAKSVLTIAPDVIVKQLSAEVPDGLVSAGGKKRVLAEARVSVLTANDESKANFQITDQKIIFRVDTPSSGGKEKLFDLKDPRNVDKAIDVECTASLPKGEVDYHVRGDVLYFGSGRRFFRSYPERP
jgi:hypothetical protein